MGLSTVGSAVLTPFLRSLMAERQAEGKQIRWRSTDKRTWLSIGDSTDAWLDAAKLFPGILATTQKENER